MSLKSFFKENNIKIENVKYIASDRFKDENGEVIEWELKVLDNKKVDELRNRFSSRSFVNHKEEFKFNSEDFMKVFVTEAIVFPNLTDKDLQDSYGVFSPYELLQEILTVGELTRLTEYINNLHDYKAEKKVDEIKN